jgi:saccharopine dehydrogenase (NADP+, L-glutamate forming)
LTASYIDEKIKALEETIRDKNLLFLCEMGLDPGLDHMSAMKIISRIRSEGGKITSFKSHCGGLISPEHDDNPWHYKITWNPGNIVMAGSSGTIYRSNGETVKVPYHKVFENCAEVDIQGLFPLAWYPNRDSPTYINAYGLDDVATFIRTTLRHPSFCRGWNKIVNLGLTALNDFDAIKDCKTYAEWFRKKALHQQIAPDNIPEPESIEIPIQPEFSEQVDFLGLRNNFPIIISFTSSASILQHLLETKLAIKKHERDMIVMLHEIGYSLNGENKLITSSMVVKGIDQLHTAMAKTVGLPLGIAAKLIMEGKINLTGLHIPISPAIYEPVLMELEHHSISFKEKMITVLAHLKNPG